MGAASFFGFWSASDLVGFADSDESPRVIRIIGPKLAVARSGQFSACVLSKDVRATLRACIFASGHTATNPPDIFRTPKLTVAGPGQY